MYMKVFLLVVFIISFDKSFKASAIGCEIPEITILFGPFRYCEIPMIFRSMSVKKATANSTPIIENKKSIRNILGFSS